MQKRTKAGIAAGGAALLLLGGLGTTAVWSDSASGSFTTISTGDLSISDGSTVAWDQDTDLLVPGDVLTGTQTFTVTAHGDNLSFAVDTAFAGGDLPAGITTDVSDVTVDGKAYDPATPIAAADGTHQVTADFTVTFDRAVSDQDLQGLRDLNVGDFTVTVTQAD